MQVHSDRYASVILSIADVLAASDKLADVAHLSGFGYVKQASLSHSQYALNRANFCVHSLQLGQCHCLLLVFCHIKAP